MQLQPALSSVLASALFFRNGRQGSGGAGKSQTLPLTVGCDSIWQEMQNPHKYYNVIIASKVAGIQHAGGGEAAGHQFPQICFKEKEWSTRKGSSKSGGPKSNVFPNPMSLCFVFVFVFKSKISLLTNALHFSKACGDQILSKIWEDFLSCLADAKNPKSINKTAIRIEDP